MQKTVHHKITPPVPSVADVERLMLERRAGGYVRARLTKKERKALWMNWLITGVIASVPLAIFIDELIYMIYPQMKVYSSPQQIQWIWAAILFVFCVIGTFLARLAASIITKKR